MLEALERHEMKRKIDVRLTENGDTATAAALRGFLLHMQSNGYADSTVHTYRTHIEPFVSFMEEAGTTFIADVKRSDVEQYQKHCKDRGNRDTTVQSYTKSIRTWLYWCMDEEMIVERYKIKLPRATECLPKTYSKYEVEILLTKPKTAYLDDWRNWAATSVCMRTGLRLSSLCELKWEDVDFQHRHLTMRHSKNRKQQLIPLCSAAMDTLIIWKSVCPADSEYVFFSTRRGGKMTPNGLYHAIAKRNKSLGVEVTGVHAMRHTFASNAIRQGMDVSKLQVLMSHSDISTTQRYLHFSLEDFRDIDEYTV